jgi:hypothetical protein
LAAGGAAGTQRDRKTTASAVVFCILERRRDPGGSAWLRRRADEPAPVGRASALWARRVLERGVNGAWPPLDVEKAGGVA